MLRYGMISQFYLHTPCLSIVGMNYTCLCLAAKAGTHLPTRKNVRLSRPGQPERWVNSRPRTATQCLSQLLTGQRHSCLTEQTGVSLLSRVQTTVGMRFPMGMGFPLGMGQTWSQSRECEETWMWIQITFIPIRNTADRWLQVLVCYMTTAHPQNTNLTVL